MRDAKYTKNIIYSGIGTAAAQIITLIASPLIAYYYSPDSFGRFSFVLAILNTLLAVSCLRLDLALLQSKDDKEAQEIISISLVSILFFVVIFLITLLILIPELSKIEVAISTLGFLSTAMFQIITAIGMRASEFKQLNLAKTLRSGAQSATQIFLPNAGYNNSLSLTFGYLIGQIAGISYLARAYDLNSLKFGFSFDTILKYRHFIIVSTPTALVGAMSINIPSFIIPLMSTSADLGAFSMAMRFIGAPNIFISQAIAQAFAAKINLEIRNDGEYKSTIIRTFKLLLLIASPLSVLLFLLVPYFFFIFLGSSWSKSISFAQILTPWIVLNFISSPMSVIAIALNRHRTSLWIAIYEIVFRFTSIFIGIRLGGITLGIILFSLSGSLISLIYVNWICNISNIPKGFFLKEIMIRMIILTSFLYILYIIELQQPFKITIEVCFILLVLMIELALFRRIK